MFRKKVLTNTRLFWFLKKGTVLNLEKKSHLNLYVQQVLTHGRYEDIKKLLRIIDKKTFKRVFGDIKNFLPKEVKVFWKEWFKISK